MISELKQQLMLPQLAIGGGETALNALINRSPYTLPLLQKLSGKVLQLQFIQPEFALYLVFSETRIDWLTHYEGEPDCAVQLALLTLPKLTNKSQLSELINDKSVVLTGDIQVLQHFSAFLDELEKDPAELLSPLLGDVLAQGSTSLIQTLFSKLKQQVAQNHQHLVDNLLNERPVLVHRLQLTHFSDEVDLLAKRVAALEKRLA